MKKNKKLIIGSFIALSLNLMFSCIALGQSNTSTVNVNRAGSLSFISVPASFDFGTSASSTMRTPAFSDPTVTAGTLPNSKKLTIQDTRGSGGFTVNVAVLDDFTNGTGGIIPVSNTPPNDNFRIVSSGNITGVTGTVVNGVTYENGFVGPQNITALVNTTSNNFSLANTFTSVPNNVLDKLSPTDILSNTLPSTQGSIGQVDIAVSSMLYVQASQQPGVYSTVMVWTLQDSTV